MASITRTLAQSAMLASVILAGACKGRDHTQAAGGDVAYDSAAAAPNATASDIDIDNISLGRSLKADNSIDDGTTDFNPRDTVIAVVETDHAPAGARLSARWTYGDNEQLIANQSEAIASTDDARTIFRIVKSSDWPKGDYHLHVLNGEKELAKKDFSIK